MGKKISDKRIEPKLSDSPANAKQSQKSSRDKNSVSSDVLLGKTTNKKKKALLNFSSILFRGFYWSFVSAIWIGIGFIGLIAYYAALLPHATTWSVPDRPPNIRILAFDGRVIANRGLTGGEALPLHKISPLIQNAVVAIEDRRFYKHYGIDPIGIIRAAVLNLLGGNITQGGSTLTQQLAKNLFLTHERTFKRKIQETLLSFWLEKKYSKDTLLEMYLNRVYFGSGSYGIEAACRRYFLKSAEDVTLGEAALLAGLLKAPSNLSPIRAPAAAKARAHLVLLAMQDQGMIKEIEARTAFNALPIRIARQNEGAGYIADKIMEQLPDLIGDIRSDIFVKTTINRDLQNLSETHIRNLIDKQGKTFRVSQGALVCIENTGEIRAMVGGRDYTSSQFDRASEARRQPGSAFKPFVFLAALEHGLTPESIRNDAPLRIGKWEPRNYNEKYYGPVPLSTALSKSLNSISAQLVIEVGAPSVIKVAKRLGIESDLKPNLSLALGTSEVTLLELTAAYLPFSNGGYRPEIQLIKEITNAKGDVLYRIHPSSPVRVIKPAFVSMMNSMMTQTIKEGTAWRANFGWPAAGKTGTSQKFRDAWFIGYTTTLTTGVWFGNDNGSPTRQLSGGSLPAIAWREFMMAAYKTRFSNILSEKSLLTPEETFKSVITPEEESIRDIILRY